MLFDPSQILRPDRAAPGHLTAEELESVEVGSDGRTLVVKFIGGNPRCWSLDQVRAKYEPKRIVLGLYGGYHPLPEGTVCTLEGVTYRLMIALDHRAGGRPIEAAAPAVSGAVVEDDPKGIFRPGRVPAEHTRAVEVHSVNVARGGRTVTVQFSGGNPNCWSVDQVLFRFEPSSILLGIYGGYHPPPGVFCTLEGRNYELIFRLDERVAGRPIVPVERLSEPP